MKKKNQIYITWAIASLEKYWICITKKSLGCATWKNSDNFAWMKMKTVIQQSLKLRHMKKKKMDLKTFYVYLCHKKWIRIKSSYSG